VRLGTQHADPIIMLALKKLLAIFALGGALSACYVHHTQPVYYSGPTCRAGYYWDGYQCRPRYH